MKVLPLYLSVLVVIAVIVGAFTIAHGWTAAHEQAWRIESLSQATVNAQVAQAEAVEQAKRAELWTGFYGWLLPSLLVLLVGVAGLIAHIKIDERHESHNRQVDGSFALQHYTNRQGQTWTVDPNKSMFGAIGFDRQSGQLITDANLTGPDRQLAYSMGIQKTRTTQARSISDIRNSAQAKLESGYYDRPERPFAPEERKVSEPEQLLLLGATPYAPLQLTDAFKQSNPECWLLGNGTDQAMRFNVKDTVHTGLVGATKTGKTSSTAMLMALNARRDGMQVIALDGAGGVDWLPHSNLFEVHESDYTTIGDQLNELVHIHDLRMKEIKRVGVPNIDALDYQLPSLFVIMEEHGRTMQAYKSANAKSYAITESALSNLMRVSRKTGIYFLLIDQSLNGWSGEVKANVKDYIAYHLGGGQGAAFNAYDLHKLRPNGQFWNNGQTFDAWHTAKEVDSVARLVQPQKYKLLTAIDTAQGDTTHGRGGSAGALDTPLQNDTVVIQRDTTGDTPSVNVIQPVSQRDTGNRGKFVSIDTSPISKPISFAPANVDTTMARLVGKPISKSDITLVQNTYAMTGSASETARLLWGSKNNSRVKWVQELTGKSAGHD